MYNCCFFGVFLRESARTAAKRRTNLSPNSGNAIKRLDRLHQIWHTCADSSGNGYTPNKLPLKTQGGTWRVFRGSKIQSLGKLSNGWIDCHQLWFMSADSSGNGHRLNISRPSITKGAFGGGLGGHKFKSLGKLSNCCTDWHQLWDTSADSSGNGHRLNTIRPSIPHGAFRGVLWGNKFKSGKTAKTAGPIGTKFGTRLWIHLGWTYATTIRPRYPRAAFGGGGLGGQQFKILGNVVKRLDRLGIHCAHYNADESGNGHRLNKLAP